MSTVAQTAGTTRQNDVTVYRESYMHFKVAYTWVIKSMDDVWATVYVSNQCSVFESDRESILKLFVAFYPKWIFDMQ